MNLQTRLRKIETSVLSENEMAEIIDCRCVFQRLLKRHPTDDLIKTQQELYPHIPVEFLTMPLTGRLRELELESEVRDQRALNWSAEKAEETIRTMFNAMKHDVSISVFIEEAQSDEIFNTKVDFEKLAKEFAEYEYTDPNK